PAAGAADQRRRAGNSARVHQVVGELDARGHALHLGSRESVVHCLCERLGWRLRTAPRGGGEGDRGGGSGRNGHTEHERKQTGGRGGSKEVHALLQVGASTRYLPYLKALFHSWRPLRMASRAGA